MSHEPDELIEKGQGVERSCALCTYGAQTREDRVFGIREEGKLPF
jgi:hypothetical protein